MKVLLVAATSAEINGVKNILTGHELSTGRTEIEILITGIGGIASTFSLTRKIQQTPPGFIIQAGIAGTFLNEFPIGSVVVVKEEILGDLGVEENNEFTDLFDLGLLSENELPFNKKVLKNPLIEGSYGYGLPAVRSISINEITTRKERIRMLQKKFSPDIESMEGAALHYVCLKENIDFLQVRAISNHVGERNKQNWNIPLAIQNLNEKVLSVLDQLQ